MLIGLLGVFGFKVYEAATYNPPPDPSRKERIQGLIAAHRQEIVQLECELYSRGPHR